MKFQIEYIAPSSEHAYVLARQLEVGEFSLSGSSQLGGVSVKQLSMPRKLRTDGNLDLTVFVFALTNGTDRLKLSVGQQVELSS